MNVILRLVFPAAALLALTCAPARATDYRFDTTHSQVFFCVSHLGFSKPCGRMHIKGGFIHFDENNWPAAKVEVTIAMASLDMGDAQWNAMLRSWQFLETDKYPTARYVSGTVEKAGDHNAIVHGELTLHGTTHPVDLQVTLNRTGMDPYAFHYTAGFSVTATLNRSNFGIKKYLPDVGDVVSVRIEVEGLRDNDAHAPTAPEAAKP